MTVIVAAGPTISHDALMSATVDQAIDAQPLATFDAPRTSQMDLAGLRHELHMEAMGEPKPLMPTAPLAGSVR